MVYIFIYLISISPLKSLLAFLFTLAIELIELNLSVKADANKSVPFISSLPSSSSSS